MERTPAEPKRSGRKEAPLDDEADDEEEEQLPGRPPARGGNGVGAENERKRSPFSTVTVAASASAVHAAARRGGGSGGGGGSSSPCCQAEMCTADLTEAKRYHRRHKVCEPHSKAAAVMVAGLRQRFCQQCSRFHELSEFDEAKRSCRRRLAGHNERRRKGSSETQGEGSNRCRQVDQNGRCRPPSPGTPTTSISRSDKTPIIS